MKHAITVLQEELIALQHIEKHAQYTMEKGEYENKYDFLIDTQEKIDDIEQALKKLESGE